MNDRKLDAAQENIFFKLEKQLEEFHALIIEFQLEMKETRDRQIQELKKKLKGEKRERIVSSKIQPESMLQSKVE